MSNSVSRPPSIPQDPTAVPDTNWHRDGLPSGYELVVTTTTNVFLWNETGVSPLFSSGSGGIVAAKRLTSNMLAIADSSIVVLHDVKKGKQKSYRLRSSEGNVRLLQYTGNDTEDLYFTTSLQNSIQAFSVKNLKLLNAQDTHPSPPTVFALSFDSQFLLSTSHQPPTIHLRNLVTKASPVEIRPSCSSSAVVAASFHPETPGIFLLAFSDGAVAVYDAAQILKRNGTARRRSAGSVIYTNELASVKRLHTPTTKSLSAVGSALDAKQNAQGTAEITGHVSGVSSVALLPGHRAMAVTVGSDGKCCVVDFSQPDKKKAVLLKSWHLRRPATSLSVVLARHTKDIGQFDGANDESAPSNKDYCIAVGRQDGKVLLFDLDGATLGAKVLDPQRSRIVNVEWAKKEIDAAFVERQDESTTLSHNGHQARRQRKVSKRKTQGLEPRRSSQDKAQSNLSRSRDTYQETPLVAALRDSRHVETAKTRLSREKLPLYFAPQSTENPEKLSLKHRHSALKVDVPSPFDRSNAGPNAYKDKSIKTFRSSGQGLITSPLHSSSGTTTPPLPPRPAAKPGGRLHTRRALRALEAAGHEVGALTASRQISRSSSKLTSRSSSRRVSVAAVPKRNVVLPLRVPSKKLSAPSPSKVAPPILPHRVNSSSGLDEYKTAPSSGPLSVVDSESEGGSSDTVIEWGTARHHPKPMVLRKPSYRVSPEPSKKVAKGSEKKGHLSLSVSSSEGEGERIPSPLPESDPSSNTAAKMATDGGKRSNRPGAEKDGMIESGQGNGRNAKRTSNDVPNLHSDSVKSRSSPMAKNDDPGQPIKDVKRTSALLSTGSNPYRTQSERADVVDGEDSEDDVTVKPQLPKQELGFAKLLSPASWLAPAIKKEKGKGKEVVDGSPSKRRSVPPPTVAAPVAPPTQRVAEDMAEKTLFEASTSHTLETADVGAPPTAKVNLAPMATPGEQQMQVPSLTGQIQPSTSISKDGLIDYLDRKFEEMKSDIKTGFAQQKAWIEERERVTRRESALREVERKAEEVVLGIGVGRSRTGALQGGWSSDEKRKGSVFGREREGRM